MNINFDTAESILMELWNGLDYNLKFDTFAEIKQNGKTSFVITTGLGPNDIKKKFLIQVTAMEA